VDGTPRSLLAFEGAVAVAGLGDWLHAEAPAGEGAGAGAEGCDVPTLLAPVPFEHAALHRLTPQVRRARPCASAETCMSDSAACKPESTNATHHAQPASASTHPPSGLRAALAVAEKFKGLLRLRAL